MRVKNTFYLFRYAHGRFPWRTLLLLSVLALYWLAFRDIALRNYFMALGSWSNKEILLLAIVNVWIIFAMCIRLWMILKRCGVTVSIGHLAVYRIASNAISYITPGPHVGGEPLQILGLIRNHRLTSELAFASVITDRVVEMVANLTLICIGSLYLMLFASLGASISSQVMALPLLVLIAVCVLLKMVAVGRRPLYVFLQQAQKLFRNCSLKSTWAAILITGEKRTREILSQPQSILWLYFGCALMQWVLMGAEIWIIYVIIGVPLQPSELIAVVLFARLAFLLPLPGALGALEASQMMILAYLQFPPSAGLAACAIMRVRDLIVVGLGVGLVSLGWGSK
jgi:uncharacterized protein (TIRG00374 family)